MDQPTLIALLNKHFAGNLDAAEKEQLMAWLKSVEADEFNRAMDLAGDALPAEIMASTAAGEDFIRRLEQQVDAMEPEEMPIHRVHIWRTAWFRYAAAIIIVFGIGAYLWNIQKEKPSVATTNDPAPVQNDVAPGGDKAILTLADGTTIILDSAGNGLLAKQGETNITKKDGSIIYDAKKYLPSEGGGGGLVYNTMRTPRGGQYQLTLPDGTQVWLNAESSITYPTAFTAKTRQVSITGEAYLEVAKDKTKPFIVKVSRAGGAAREADGGGLEIEVLGTRFNVSAYADEPNTSTTLLEGSVRLTSHVSLFTNKNSTATTLTLQPGQQGQLKPGQQLSLVTNPDLEQVMAWKNGLFLMSNTDLPAIMRQISRWYDVEVVFEQKPDGETFGGGISRNYPLSEILDLLEDSGVEFRLEGKTLYVRP